MPKLKLIVTTGFSNASIDMQAAIDHGVTVCGTRPDIESASELTWGLIISLLKNIPREYKSIQNGGWQTTVGLGLRGRTLGIVGLGRIGTKVARVGHAFEMQIIAWSPNLTPEAAAERGARLVEKDELFRVSDIVTTHLVLSSRSRGIIGKHELGLMKPSAYIINTARGPLIDEPALLESLINHRIAGAGLDVFDTEPLPALHPFRTLDNAVLTPHVGGVTEERYRIRYQDSVDNVRAWLNGKPIREFGPDGKLREM